MCIIQYINDQNNTLNCIKVKYRKYSGTEKVLRSKIIAKNLSIFSVEIPSQSQKEQKNK